MKDVHDIIIAPIVTEASMMNIADKRYTFKVAKSAVKPEIAAAVEKCFGVKVAKVNTVTMRSKPKRVGAHPEGRTAEWKKAIVTLTADSKTIEFFDGMQ